MNLKKLGFFALIYLLMSDQKKKIMKAMMKNCHK